MRAYKYVFYTLYHWSSRWKADVTPPEVTALLGMVVIVWWNALLLVEIVESCVGTALLPKLSKTAIMSVMALLAVPQYFLLLHARRYKQIAKEFEGESSNQSFIRRTVVWLYIVLSFILLVVGAILRAHVLHH